MDAPAPSALAPLRHPAFRLLWSATLVSNLGSLIQTVGAAWAMTELSSSAGMVALVQASATLPIMALAMVAGAIADNFDRRRVMLAAQLFMAAVSILLSLAGWAGWLGPWSLLAFTFLIGAGAAMHLPSWQASMRDLVPLGDLPAAIALNSVGFNLMRSVGPALGGLVVAAAGAPAAFALNAVSYVAVIAALLLWRRDEEPARLPAERLGSAIRDGLRYVALSPNLMRVMARAFLFGFAAVPVMALLPLIARDRLGSGATIYGALLGVFGLGAITGAFASAHLRRIATLEVIIRGAFIASALGALTLAFARTPLAAAPGLLVCGAAWVLALSHFNVSTQLAAPRWVVGRALALYQTMSFGGMALGAWVWGALAEGGTIPLAMAGSALALVAGAVLGLALPMPDLSVVNLDPANRFNAPALRLDLKARSGPIVIMVEWRIAPADTGAFLALMTERRRIRRRDGAGNWQLLRDLESLDTWIETYQVATWTDYIRHNQRRTHSDSGNYDRLIALHRGPGRPHVRRMIGRSTVAHRLVMPLADPTGH